MILDTNKVNDLKALCRSIDWIIYKVKIAKGNCDEGFDISED